VRRRAAIVLYVLALVAVVVGVDVLFLRHQFAVRLIVNIGIVLVFVAVYLRFLGVHERLAAHVDRTPCPWSEILYVFSQPALACPLWRV
jgi:hypothetical protein